MSWGIYEVWPFFVCLGFVLALAASPAVKAVDGSSGSNTHRVSTIDGIRGFLALSVFFHHGAIYHRYLTDGVWASPPSAFYAMLGQFGVALFFMVTGFLFWSILIRNGGRPDWIGLYIGRLFRIGPLYLFAVGAMLLIVVSRTGVVLNEPARRLGYEICRWLALGLGGGGPDVNGYAHTGVVLAGVTWTLHFEWLFYFSLPISAYFARGRVVCWAFPATSLALLLTYLFFYRSASPTAPPQTCAALFSIGMLCAAAQTWRWPLPLPNILASVIVLILFSAVFVSSDDANTFWPLLSMGGGFWLIASGCSVFGLLATAAARRLGNASYGIYLLQGLVLNVVFAIAPLRGFALVSGRNYWLVLLFCAVILVLLATAAHALIELPGIRAGRRIGTTLTAYRRSRQAWRRIPVG